MSDTTQSNQTTQTPKTHDAQISQSVATSQSAQSVSAQPEKQSTEKEKKLNPKSKPSIKSNEIAKQTKRFAVLAVATSLLFIALSFVLVLLINNQQKQLQSIRKQISTKTTDIQSQDQTAEFIETNTQTINSFLKVLPNENSLVDFVDAVESLSNSTTSSSSLEFSALAPTGSDIAKYIPFVITLSTNMPNFYQYLNQLERLPYIIEISSIESQLINSQTDSWNFTIVAFK